MSAQELGRIETVQVREIWKDEARDFTPWLAQAGNLALLGDAVGMDLELEGVEKAVGPFSADILCRNARDDRWVLIENQLECTDHTHLGQIITYAAGLDAPTTIWASTGFREEHRAALDWLNQATDETTHFFGVEVSLVRIAGSVPAPIFDVVAKPNDWSKTVSKPLSTSVAWTEDRFFEELAARSPDAVAPARRILQWAGQRMPEVYWGTGARSGSFTPGLESGGYWHQVVGVWTQGYVELQFQYMKSKPPFNDDALRQELADRFARALGTELPSDAINRRPGAALAALADPAVADAFFGVLDWFVDSVTAAATG